MSDGLAILERPLRYGSVGDEVLWAEHYQPLDEAAADVLVDVHGGAFSSGNRFAGQRYCRRLARAGIATRASTGPQEVAVLAQDRPGADSAEISRIADLYLHLRYAPGAPGFPEFARAVKAFSPPAGPRHGA